MNTDILNMNFLLNMQIIVDHFNENFSNINFFKGNDDNTLTGFRFLTLDETLSQSFVYITDSETLSKLTMPSIHSSFIVIGDVPTKYITAGHSIIKINESENIINISNICQYIFNKNNNWANTLRNIIIMDGTIDDLCKESYNYFKNPLFVHDSQLYVLSCPIWRNGMIDWAKDDITGLTITPLDTINEFKTDKEYLATLETKGAQLFSAALRGYRDIYVNLWDEYNKYSGRLCICELETSLKPGQYIAAEYLAKLVSILMNKKSRLDNTYHHALEILFSGMIHGEYYSESEIKKRIEQYGWNIDDTYIFIRINTEERDKNLISIVSTCNHIENLINGSKVFCNESHICIIINLKYNNDYNSDIACILREGLFKAGISNKFNNFTKLSDYYKQASIALEYCHNINDTRWSINFDDIALNYIIDSACPNIDINTICSYKLIKLIEYDKTYQTELYNTLRVYIENERNTVKSSKELYVGRSTLFYRLRKIKDITGLDTENLSNPSLNLYLRISFYLLNKKY